MKKTIITLIAVLPLFLIGQVEKVNYKETSAKFQELYNSDQYSEIFNLFSKEMKEALPLEKTEAFLSGLKTQVGNIQSREFKGFENGTYAVYKTTFEHAVMALNISVNRQSKINGLLVKPYIERGLPELKRNTTALILPFRNEWTVIWGGDTKELNYHIESKAQQGAFDIVITDTEGSTHRTDGSTNEDYYCFGEELIAPCDAEVVLAVDGIRDNKPGDLNPIYIPGNTVILKTDKDEFLFFAHFKQHSVAVKEGQKVESGDLLGLCGNSGNSTEPHLHFHTQNIEDMNQATGAKTYFKDIMVNGEEKQDYSPIQGEKIKNP